MLWLALCICATLYSCSALSPTKSPNDQREYKIITLANNLTAILVSDPTTDFSAASMNVQVGSMSNPHDLLGLAHFCEHMLFLGTKKFPSESEFSEYLATHGGNDNAYTAEENTNYFFKIDKKFLYGALQRWSQFFIAPLFTETAVGREVNAVSSEHSKNMASDDWRLWEIVKTTSNPNHPFSLFSTGNNKSLVEIPLSKGLSVREELLKFHAKFYSANVMKLAVLGQESIDQLEKWVLELFTEIPNKSIDVPSWSVPPMRPEDLKKQVNAVPIKNEDTLSILFPISETFSTWDMKCPEFVSHIVAHEAQGTLIDTLRKKGWATSLNGGVGTRLNQFAFLEFSVSLTSEGLIHVDDIMTYFFTYISKLFQEISSKNSWTWRYQELAQMAKASFQYLDKTKPDSYVTDLSHNLQLYPLEHVLDWRYVYYNNSDQKLQSCIQNIINAINPNNVRTLLASQSVSKTPSLDVEPWYGTQYKSVPFTYAQLQAWQAAYDYKTSSSSQIYSELLLPDKNIFIPTSYDLKTVPKESQTEFPVVVVDKPLLKSWYKFDTIFSSPRANVIIHVITPSVYSTLTHYASSLIFLQMFRDGALSFGYYAQLAELGYDVAPTARGIQFTISGYTNKLSTLTSQLFTLLLSPNFINNNSFLIAKKKVTEKFNQQLFDFPVRNAMQILYDDIVSPAYTLKQLMYAVEHQITIDDCHYIHAKIFSSFFVELLAHGNLVKDDVLQISDNVLNILSNNTAVIPVSGWEVPFPRTIELPANSSFRHSVRNLTGVACNSAVITYLQVGPINLKESAIISVFQKMMWDKAFAQLRTVEQLGYIAGSTTSERSGSMGFVILVQSAIKEPTYLDTRIDHFLFTNWKTDLLSMTNETLSDYIDGVATDIVTKSETLMVETTKFWGEILGQTYMFDRSQKKLEKLKALTKADMIKFSEKYIYGPTRRRFSVHIVGYPETPALPIDQQLPQTEISSEVSKLKLNPMYPLGDANFQKTDPVFYNEPQSCAATSSCTSTSTTGVSATTSASVSTTTTSSSTTSGNSGMIENGYSGGQLAMYLIIAIVLWTLVLTLGWYLYTKKNIGEKIFPKKKKTYEMSLAFGEDFSDNEGDI